MNSDRNRSAEFWLALLKLGDSEEERRRSWNIYCGWKCGGIIEQLLTPGEREEIGEKLNIPSSVAGGIEGIFDQIAAEHGGHPQPGRLHSYMDLSGKELPKYTSFAGRVLIGANFRGTVFSGRRADFTGAEFIGLTEFDGADFRSIESNGHRDHGSSFSRSTFHNQASFDRVRFSNTTNFNGAVFRDSASFSQIGFGPGDAGSDDPGGGIVEFDRAEFHGSVDFWKTEFCSASFAGAEMKGAANFRNARFRGSINFNNARFRGTTSFADAEFWKPPKFFEAELHEDVTFTGADWKEAENFNRHASGHDNSKAKVRNDAEAAMRAWDRLALIMGQQEKLLERHEFYRLMMRARRHRDGRWSLSSIVNWLFDRLSDYGWGIGRAFFWWCIHILAGAALLTVGANCPMMAWHSLQVSFANSLAFLRLGSEGGYLHGPHSDLETATAHAEWVFILVGTSQAVLGPVLLFLVLLTLRNRFRLG